MIIYVGDARKLVTRIRSNHCSGNVEGSALRRHIAESKGWPFTRRRRPSGTTRVRLNLPNPRDGEKAISEYIKSGQWKYCLCNSYDEANDFQWYAIEKLKPRLNADCRKWDGRKNERYHSLLNTLISSPEFTCEELKEQPSGPGVYVLFHDFEP